MCVCMPAVCLFVCFVWESSWTVCKILLGGGRGSSGRVSAKYQIIIDVTWHMLNTRKYFLRENVAQVAFRSIISTGIVCNECYILFR